MSDAAPTKTPTELTITGGRPLRGRLQLPGCKGISHRALLFAAIAEGRSVIRGLADGADVASTVACLDALGVKPGDRLELTQSPEGYLLRARTIDRSRLAPLQGKLRKGRGAFDLAEFRAKAHDRTLRD